MTEKPERELLAEISRKLDRLIGLVAVQGLDEDVKIDVLTSLGFTSPEIGVLLALPPGTVRRRRTTKGNKPRSG